ncbi:MAG: alkaline phosphatase family protein, partial [Flavobacteriales bacterium]
MSPLPLRLFLLGLMALPMAPSIQAKGKTTPPRLIVAITVDQMRADYLTRYAHGFGKDGFQRFANQGFRGLDHH